jgi:hypothetical protein
LRKFRQRGKIFSPGNTGPASVENILPQRGEMKKTSSTKRARGSLKKSESSRDVLETDEPPTEGFLNLLALKRAYCKYLADEVEVALSVQDEDNEFKGRARRFQVCPDATMLAYEEPLFTYAGHPETECIFIHPHQYALLHGAHRLVLTSRWTDDQTMFEYQPRYEDYSLLVTFEAINRNGSHEGSFGLTLKTSLILSDAYFVGKTPCATRLHSTPLRPRRQCLSDTAAFCYVCHCRIACSKCADIMRISPGKALCKKCEPSVAPTNEAEGK